MSRTTFSGPVVSQAGFITGTDVVQPAVTAATLALTADDYNGEIVPISKADGTAVTLPAASGSQARFTILVSTTISSNSTTLKVANATDVMVGTAAVSATTGVVYSTVAASDTITLNGSTTGGVAGSYIEVTDIASGIWLVRAALVGSGTPSTPFSATVS